LEWLGRRLDHLSALPSSRPLLRGADGARAAPARRKLAGRSRRRGSTAVRQAHRTGPELVEGLAEVLADTQARLTAAIAGEHSVELTYWTAGRGELTRRRVDPYRLETRDRVTYLVAYCHLRRAERVFRLDRIIAVADSEPAAAIVQPPPPSAANDDDLIVPF